MLDLMDLSFILESAIQRCHDGVLGHGRVKLPVSHPIIVVREVCVSASVCVCLCVPMQIINRTCLFRYGKARKKIRVSV